MPKSVPAEQQQDTAMEQESGQDAVIIDQPRSVTKLPRRAKNPSGPGKRQRIEKPSTEDDVEPAPRSKMRERVLASSKSTQAKAKKPRSKRLDDDVWDRQDAAASFEDRPEPARHFSGRAVALLAVLFVAALIMAQPLQLLLEQQADITHAQQQLEHENQRQEDLETQLERWEDPAFVQQQARERFNMVQPGERKYVVLDDDDELRTESESGTAPIDEDVEMGWADRLWGSVMSSGLD